MQKKPSRELIGRLSCHPDGYGFVVLEDPSMPEDIFIPAQRMKNATHGDRVKVRLRKRRRGRDPGRKRGPEGEIIEVLSRAEDTVVGKLFRYRGETYLSPLDPRYHYTIRVLEEKGPPAPDGKIASVAILVPPSQRQAPFGKIVELLGDPDDPEIQYRIVCHTHQIPLEFPREVLAQAEEALPPGPEELAGRADFRGWLTVTVDGKTARDFDDAISIEKRGDGSFRLGVHIADVAHYVASDTPLDVEGFVRGTSVYFPDRAIPMLPERLSNDLCSLKPGQDRLCVSVVMEVDRRGTVQRAEFCNSVIRSNERMTYEALHRLLDQQDPDLRRRYAYLLESFEGMIELSRILQEKRRRRGAIDFDLPEPEVVYDPEGKVRDIVRSERTEAHRIIEEFMLLANETGASYLEGRGLPLIFRVHEPPDPAKVENFQKIAASFGYGLERSRATEYHPRDFQKLTRKLQGKKEGKFLSYLLLRSFKQARYSEINRGHFGLAADSYTHFTSPIRRYPDLVVHRILKAALAGQTDSPSYQRLSARLEEIAEQSSLRERQAMEAEREILRWIMAQFMAERLGEEYEAFITGVKDNGFFVELFDHFVEGFVPVAVLWDDYYVFHPRHYCLVGENHRRSFRIGDRVRVRVDKVDPHRHLIDFSVVLSEGPGKKRPRRSPGRP